MKTEYLRFSIVLALHLFAATLFANTYIVTNTMDSGAGSLRDAVNSANSNPGIDTIIFDIGINGDTILLTAADDIDITGALYIKGNGPANTIIDGNNNARIFEIASFLFCKLEGMTLQNGNASGSFPDNAGGAILNDGILEVRNSVIENNSAEFGGGISNVDNSTLDLHRTLIRGNNANSGGGVDNFNISTTNFYNSSLAGNQADVNGGGVYNTGISIVNFFNSTISGNQADAGGGGVFIEFTSTTNFTNSIIALNLAPTGPDLRLVSGTVSASHSLIGNNSESSFPAGNNNIIGTSGSPIDPLFAEDVPTAPSAEGNLRLQPCSPAINAGTNDSLNLASDTIDIAGEPRIVYDTVDMGAYEMQNALFSDDLLVITPYNDGCGSLRSAVDNAMPGDTVRFDPSIDGNTIRLTSTDGIDILDTLYIKGNGTSNTIIDGNNDSRIFEIAEDILCEMEGLTLQNGEASGSAPDNDGGAIYNSGTLSMYNCLVINNSATRIGGGIFNATDSKGKLIHCKISGNEADNSAGGIAVFDSEFTFLNCSIDSNNAGFAGGAYHLNSTVHYTNCSINGNISNNSAGGLLNTSGSSATFNYCAIENNSAIDDAGGLYNFDGSTADIYYTSIRGNEADIGGGVANDIFATVTFYNCIISGNEAYFRGGGLNNRNLSTLNFYNSTIAGNLADQGGGIFNEINSITNLVSSIIAKNTSNVTVLGPDIFRNSGIVSATHSMIGDSTASGFPPGNNNIIGTMANPVDPLFAQDIPTAPSSGGNLRLQPCSPAINAGINDSLELATDTVDLAGNPRIAYDTVDMGAFEMQGALFSDDLLVITTYDDGCGSLRSAVNNAQKQDTVRFDPSIDGDTIKQTGDQIIIDTSMTILGNGADHTIIDACDTGRIFQIGINDTVTIKGVSLKNGVEFVGGAIFNNGGILSVHHSNISGSMSTDGGAIYNSSILGLYDCTLFENEALFGGAIFNAGNMEVYDCEILDNEADLVGGGVDNFGVTTANFYNTNIKGNLCNINGGGLRNFGSVTINFFNSTIIDNEALGDGGGMYNDGAMTSFHNSTVSGNKGDSGGGIRNIGGSMALFYDTNISDNEAISDGGGIDNYNNSTANFINSYIVGNQANIGGGIHNELGSSVSFFNAAISGNLATRFGGGLENLENSTATFINSTISGNQANDSGGGIEIVDNSMVSFSNSIIAKNGAPSAPDIFFESGTITASHSLIGDNTDSNFPLGNNNIIGTVADPIDPLFVMDVDTMDLPNSSGDLRLQSCSPAINAGINDSLDINDTIDLFGNPRIAYDTVDMGAFEYPDPATTDTIFYADCPCLDTLVIDQATISGLYRAGQVIRIEGNVTLSGATELWAREVMIDPVFEAPVGVRFETFNVGCE